MRRHAAGQTATEYMLLVSVIVVALTAAAYVFLPTFQAGVQALAIDVSTILDTGSIGGLGADRGGGGARGAANMPTINTANCVPGAGRGNNCGSGSTPRGPFPSP